MSPNSGLAPIIRVAAGVLALALAGGVVLWTFLLRTPTFPQPPLSGKAEQRRLTVGGVSRSFIVYVPARVADPAPVVLVLHGAGSSAERMRSTSAWAFEELADRDGAIVVYPEGFEGQWNDCRAEGEFPARRLALDDVAFLRAVVARLDGDPALGTRQLATDQVFAVGLSNGGHMAFRLALEAPDFVAGIAAVAASLPATSNTICKAQGKAVPVFIVNGDADPVSPYEGGRITALGPINRRGEVQASLATVDYFRELAGYTAPPFEHRYPDMDPEDGTVAMRMVWSEADRAEVDLVTIYGGGHTIPHPVKQFPRILGRTSHDVAAAEEIWRFFRRQLIPGGAGN